MQSPTRALIDLRLSQDGGLDKLVADRRVAGVSWRKIEIEILDRTGVSVRHETLRVWYFHLRHAS